MIVVIQKVLEASVTIQEQEKSSIKQGLLVLIGIAEDDDQTDIDWLSRKICNLRVFCDDQGIMNKSLLEVDGELLIVSQFTLHASTKKGNRPSYTKAANPSIAIPLYDQFILSCESILGRQVSTGAFGADMKVSLINDGPVTIIIDTKDKK